MEDGVRFNGHWVDGVPHGEGRKVFPNGNWVAGNFINGYAQGHGSVFLYDVGMFEGNLRDNLPHGRGTLTFLDGYRIVGGFSDGFVHGDVRVYTPSGAYEIMTFVRGVLQ